MTTVVACTRDGQVFMAADSLTNVYERPIYDGARKVRRIPVGDGELLLAVSGAGGIADAAQADLRPEPPRDDDLQAWAGYVAHLVTDIGQERGFVDDGHLDASLLLGYAGRLWTIAHGVAIPHPDGIAALGSGEGPAIGALDVLLDQGEAPAAAVLAAVHIGCGRDKHSAPPVYAECLAA